MFPKQKSLSPDTAISIYLVIPPPSQLLSLSVAWSRSPGSRRKWEDTKARRTQLPAEYTTEGAPLQSKTLSSRLLGFSGTSNELIDLGWNQPNLSLLRTIFRPSLLSIHGSTSSLQQAGTDYRNGFRRTDVLSGLGIWVNFLPHRKMTDLLEENWKLKLLLLPTPKHVQTLDHRDRRGLLGGRTSSRGNQVLRNGSSGPQEEQRYTDDGTLSFCSHCLVLTQ
jgi:hypothetical protein